MNILKNKKNVFSDNRSEINILVYTEGFLKENEAIEFLKKADELTGINIYKHKQLFSEFQNYWSAVCKSKALDDWADALDNRLELMTICFDQCKIEAYKSQNNTTVMYLKYHLSHLLLLITGTFDNLAWIINNQYDLKLHRMKIDLRGKDFKEAVENRSPMIHEILTDEEIVAVIDAIRELRDRIVHRDFIKAIRGGRVYSNYETSYFYIDTRAFDLLRNAGLPDGAIECLITNAAFIDMIAFINFLESCTVSLVNRLLKVIAREIYNANDTYEIWKLLGFAVEPYVL